MAMLPALILALAPAPQPALEAQVLAEINFARTDPQAYADRLRAYRKLFRGKIVYYPGRRDGLLTKEGTRAVDEAIRFLDRQVPLPPIGHSELLAATAGELATDQGRSGKTGHASPRGSAQERLKRRGGGGNIGEVITYGPPSAIEVVRQLIVDDDVPGRGHRKLLYMPEMRYAGVRCGAHPGYGKMCVANLSPSSDGR